MSDMQEKYPQQQEEEIMTYSKKELMEAIEKDYGFKRELIQNAEVLTLPYGMPPQRKKLV